MNQMADEEAKGAQVETKDRKRYFRVDNDAKSNMQAPAESADWFKIISVPLYNDKDDQNAPGDSIGVTVKWALPSVFADIQDGDLARVQDKIASGNWAQNVQSDDWAGFAAAEVLGLDATDTSQKERIKRLLQAWIGSGALKVKPMPNPRNRGHNRPEIVIGERV